MFLPNTHHVFTQYTVKYVMKPVEYMKGENLTENRGKTWPHPAWRAAYIPPPTAPVAKRSKKGYLGA